MSVDAITKLKFIKTIAPDIFQNATPKFHIQILNFLHLPDKYEAAAIFRGAGKTSIVNKVDGVCSLYFDKEPYQQIFSSNEKKAMKFLKDIKTMIINAMLKGYNIKKGSIWTNTEIEVIVDGKHHCFIESMGAGQDPRGGSFNFMRPTRQIFDDIESKVGQYAIRNKANREKLEEWFYGDCLPSLDPQRGKVRFIGTILHADSLLSKLLRDKNWKKIIIPIIINGKSAWADRFPLTKEEAKQKENEYYNKHGKRIKIESIDEIKESLFDRGHHNLFYQEYLCKPQAVEKMLFKYEHFQYFKEVRYAKKIEKIELKNALECREVYIKTPTDIVLEDDTIIPLSSTYVYSTMDLASDGKDATAIVTAAYDTNGNMYILDISAGHWSPFEKSVQAIRIQKTFNPIRFGIEKASAQNDFFYTINVAQKEFDTQIPVETLTHGGVNKNIRIANLHPMFMTKKIFFNRSDINTTELEGQLLSFDLDVESLKDDIMDCLAYQMNFIQNRSFEEYDDDYESSVWY